MRARLWNILAAIMLLIHTNVSAQDYDTPSEISMDSILANSLRMLHYHDSIGDSHAAILDLWNISWMYNGIAKIRESMIYLEMAKDRSEKSGDTIFTPTLLSLAGDNYRALGAYQTALANYRQADSIYLAIGDKGMHIFTEYCMAYCYENLYDDYPNPKIIDTAFNIIKEQFPHITECYPMHKPYIAMMTCHILLSKSETEKPKEARQLSIEAHEIAQQYIDSTLGADPMNMYRPYFDIIKIDTYTKLDSLQKAKALIDKINASHPTEYALTLFYKAAARYYKRIGDYKTTLEYYGKTDRRKLSIYNADNIKQSEQYSAERNFEKLMKEYNDAYTRHEQDFERKKENAESINRILKVNIIILAFIIIIFVIDGVALLNMSKKLTESKNKIAQQNADLQEINETIESQNAEISQQLITIKEQNERSELYKTSMQEAIRLAGSIQNAIMTSHETMRRCLGEHFVYLRPTSLVSGDFYWMREAGKYTYLIAADATGHGVPGAFLSMLGISMMNDISHELDLGSPYTMPGEFLDIMKERFTKMLGIGKKQMSDSIDLALIKIDKHSQKITYSGANRPLLIVSHGEYTEYRPTKMCIGYTILDRGNFVNTELQYSHGDMIYVFSDGYVDQFGGSDGHTKFGSRRFYKLLASLADQPTCRQETTLKTTMQDWMRNDASNAKAEQIDDQLVIGIRM